MSLAGSSPSLEPGRPDRLRELAALFLRLGATAFGGPAAHIAMMHDEVVTRRRWLSEQRFLDLLGATNLVPGPASTELAIHIGYVRAGWAGLAVAGASFIAPAMLIVLALAWAYVEYGHTETGRAILYGIEPVVIAIVAVALVRLGRTGMRSAPMLLALGATVFALYLAGVNELVLLFGSGLLVVLIRGVMARGSGAMRSIVPIGLVAATVAADTAHVALWRIFLQFLKFGAIVYGSGYVLFAFIRGDLVERLHWITQQQLLDSLAVGQLTPGPVFTTATFVGYLLAGVPGAIVATLGMFLPAFAFVALLVPIMRLAARPWARAALDGVNMAAIGLMAGVCWQLGREAIVDVPTAAIGVFALAVLLRFRVNSGWLILAGAVAGGIVWLAR